MKPQPGGACPHGLFAFRHSKSGTGGACFHRCDVGTKTDSNISAERLDYIARLQLSLYPRRRKHGILIVSQAISAAPFV